MEDRMATQNYKLQAYGAMVHSSFIIIGIVHACLKILISTVILNLKRPCRFSFSVFHLHFHISSSLLTSTHAFVNFSDLSPLCFTIGLLTRVQRLHIQILCMQYLQWMVICNVHCVVVWNYTLQQVCWIPFNEIKDWLLQSRSLWLLIAWVTWPVDTLRCTWSVLRTGTLK